MQIILVGLNHRTAPIALREQMALASCGLRMALDVLNGSDVLAAEPARSSSAHDSLKESVILSTCNRLEIYGVVTGEAKSGWRYLEQFLAGLQGVPERELLPHLYHLAGHEAILHLMKVASGLDSMILGEPQILGQVAKAQTEARSAG